VKGFAKAKALASVKALGDALSAYDLEGWKRLQADATNKKEKLLALAASEAQGYLKVIQTEADPPYRREMESVPIEGRARRASGECGRP
jgi:hypothetical protein